jgi:hypothetical protein
MNRMPKYIREYSVSYYKRTINPLINFIVIQTISKALIVTSAISKYNRGGTIVVPGGITILNTEE